MSKSLRRFAGSFGFLLAFALSGPGFAQNQATTFCLADGTQINAERFETREGKFLLYVPGSSQPLVYPSSSVKGINVKCEPPAAAPAQPQQTAAPSSGRFGIHGSNTIGERLMPMLIEAYGTKKLGVKPVSKLGASEEQEITMFRGQPSFSAPLSKDRRNCPPMEVASGIWARRLRRFSPSNPGESFFGTKSE